MQCAPPSFERVTSLTAGSEDAIDESRGLCGSDGPSAKAGVLPIPEHEEIGVSRPQKVDMVWAVRATRVCSATRSG